MSTRPPDGKPEPISGGSQDVDNPTATDVAARRRAFAEVVEPEIDVMLRVARGLTRSPADAEDLVQEALIRAFGAVERFDGRHPRAWLLTIVRRTHLNMHRRRRPITVDDDELLRGSRPAFGSAHAPGADEVVADDELDDRLRAALEALSPPFRSAVVLVDVLDLSYAEAAAVLDVPVGTVMSRLSRARSRLRAALGPSFTTREEQQ